MNKIMRYYQDLLGVAKNQGIKIIHYNKPHPFYWAVMQQPENIIRIDISISYTLFGAFMLGHELGHWVDYQDRKFPEWHWDGTYYQGHLPTQYVRKLEWSATTFSKQLLKDRGISTKNIKECDKEFFETKILPLAVMGYNTL